MSKKNPADVDAERLFSIREDVANSGNRHAAQLVLTIALALFVFIMGVLIYILPKKNFSENENRLLAELPTASIENIISGRFAKQLRDFYSDLFPLRDGFVAMSSYTELALGRCEANSVVLLKGGSLAERRALTLDNRNSLKNTLDTIKALKSSFSVESTVAVVPDALTAQSNNFAGYEKWLDEACIYISAGGEGAYFKTDHHRTAYGAYLSYTELGKSLGYEPYNMEDFSVEIVSTEFYGTAWSRSGLYLTSPESLELWRYNGDNDFLVSGDLVQKGFYDMSKLSAKDKYAVFFGGNHGHIEITDFAEKPRLLVIKDSFANAMLPFLARHFELCVVDPRYFYGDINALAKDCDQVLFLYGINSLITDRDIIRLTF